MSNAHPSSQVRVVLSQDGSYRDIVDFLRQQGAAVMALEASTRTGLFAGKGAILRQILSTRALKLRHWWKTADRVLVVGWQVLPILALIKMRFLARPTRLIAMACFVHSAKMRRVVNILFRVLHFDGLGFITFSRAERENLINAVGIPESQVLFHLWRQELDGRPKPEEVYEGDYVFSGGYSNRDYGLLLGAAANARWRLMIVASSLNKIDLSLCPRAEIYTDIHEKDFEQKLAGSRLVVIPLQSVGEACGQSVLLRVLRNGKALIASRHESIEDYLGEDYPGFVAPGDMADLSQMIERALADSAFHAALRESIQRAHVLLMNRGTPGEEVYAFLNCHEG